MRTLLVTLLALLQLSWAGSPEEEFRAGIDNHAKAAYFVLASSGYVFALNVAANGDVYYHMNAPASHSWMGVGFGSDMTNTRMLISYIGEDGHHLTNTVRMAKGHSEPEWEDDMVIEGIYNDTYAPFSNSLSPDGIMIAHAVCRNCSTWATGGIDTTSTTQPFIFALGPNSTLRSDDPNAALRIHQFHGNFQLDMTVATNNSGSYGRVPAPQDPGLQVGEGFWAFANYFSSNTYNTRTDAEWVGIVHAVFMCLAFLLVLPLGAISLRLLRRVMAHAAVQAISLGLVVIGLGLGIYASRMYNKSKSFHSAHQVLGLLIFAALLLQIGLGLSHHYLYIRSGTPTPLGKIHRYLGLTIPILATINGGLGLQFASSNPYPYIITTILLFLIYLGISLTIYLKSQSRIYKPEKTSSFADCGLDPPDEYEMHHTPFARKGQRGYVQTPRTPFFGTQQRYRDDGEEDLRARRREEGMGREGESLETDTPASDMEGPFKGKWEAVSLR